MSKRIRTLALVGLALATVSCNSKPEAAGGTPDVAGNQTAAAKPVVLPPSIVSSPSFRCADGSLAFVDFYSDGMSARISFDSKEGRSVLVKGDGAGKTMLGDGGYALTGGATDKSVTLTSPGHPKQTCHV